MWNGPVVKLIIFLIRNGVQKAEGEVKIAIAILGGEAAAICGGPSLASKRAFLESEEASEIPRISLCGIYCTLVMSTALLAFHTEFEQITSLPSQDMSPRPLLVWSCFRSLLSTQDA